MRIVRVVVLAVALFDGCYQPARAYRPFSGTDAAVAEPGEVEIELGPAEYLRDGAERTLFVPSTTLNYGFAPSWETVVEGNLAHGLSVGARRTSLVGNGVFLKTVVREGSLQDKAGPSIATEFGALLPEIRGERGTGASLAGIVSQRWEWATLHLNAAASVNREHNADLFLGIIAEGPFEWPVRPVAELFYERDLGRLTTRSALVGVTWQVRDNLAVDFGLRGARVNDHTAGEIRAGVTFAFTVR